MDGSTARPAMRELSIKAPHDAASHHGKTVNVKRHLCCADQGETPTSLLIRSSRKFCDGGESRQPIGNTK